MKGDHHLEIRHLIYFQAVAKYLNFSKAAKSLNISQPPLSMQIAQLEEEIGVRLFHRTNRKVELTEAGYYFNSSCDFIINLLNKEIDTTKKIHAGELGTIVLGFSGSAVYDILPTIIKEMKLRHPNLNIVVEQHTSGEQEKLLLNGHLNLGILVPPVSNEKIKFLPINQEDFKLVLPLDHEYSKLPEPIDLSILKDEDFIMTPEESGKGYYDSVISLCNNAGFYPVIAQRAQEQQTIISLVASELGVALVPNSSTNIINSDVVFKSIKQQYKKTTALAWHVDSQSPGVKLFRKLINNLIDTGKIK